MIVQLSDTKQNTSLKKIGSFQFAIFFCKCGYIV